MAYCDVTLATQNERRLTEAAIAQVLGCANWILSDPIFKAAELPTFLL
jgi:hypothetical protein